MVKLLGLSDVRVTEVSFTDEGRYLGVVHCAEDTNQKSFSDMKKEFRELSDSDDPFDANEILNKYYNKDGK